MDPTEIKNTQNIEEVVEVKMGFQQEHVRRDEGRKVAMEVQRSGLVPVSNRKGSRSCKYQKAKNV